MLAVVIPYFKKIYFEETLKSLAHQTNKNFNVYIGDDASPEDPLEIINRYQNRFQLYYHRFENNVGKVSLVEQWERCVSLIHDEEWIMILGDDDYLDETVIESWFSQQHLFLEKSYVIRFASKIVNENTGKISDVYLHPQWENAADSFFRRFKWLTRSSLSEYIFSRSKLIEFGFQSFPLAWHTDNYCWLDFSCDKPIYSINDSIVYIRVSGESISGMNNNVAEKNWATEVFLKKIIAEKFSLFSIKQRLEILKGYEAAIKNNRKLLIAEWLMLLKLYLINFKIIPVTKFFRRLILNYLSK